MCFLDGKEINAVTKLEKLTDKVFYFPHKEETDRPMLGYIKGDNISLAVDSGNSPAHVDEFYAALEKENLANPSFTVITHWHWDHTFGMQHINGLSIAYKETNSRLKLESAKLSNQSYINSIKQENGQFKKEYEAQKLPSIKLSDIQYDGKIVLNLGGATAQIFHSEAPHSDDSTLIFIPEERVLFLGDAICGDFYNNGFIDKRKLQELISVIESTDCEYTLLSHSEPLKKHELLEYLSESLLNI